MKTFASALNLSLKAPQITIREKYHPATEIKTQEEADAYFEACVQHNLKARELRGEPQDRSAAENVERANLGYYAGYYDEETRARVERLFRCSHPVFGRTSHEKG